MGLVVPRGDAGRLHGGVHRAAVVGAIEQEVLQHGSVAGNEARAHARHVAALGQRRQHHQVAEIVAAERLGGLQAAQRRLVAEIDLRVALVAGDDEAVAIAQLEQRLPLRQRHHRAGRVAGRADVQQLRARPGGRIDLRPVGGEVARRVAVGVGDLRAGQQRRAFVDLIEGVGADDRRARFRRVDHRLRQREQRLARAVDGQHLRRRIQGHAVAPLRPACAGVAQLGLAGRGGVAREAAECAGERRFDELRRRMLGLAHAQADGPVRGRGGDVGGQRPEALEGVGVQALQQRIHAPIIDGATERRGSREHRSGR